MGIKNYYEEFEKRYDKPVVDKAIVGFSGIDPQLKQTESSECGCDPTKLTEEQTVIVNDMIDSKIDGLEIICDCGVIGEEPEPPTPVPLDPLGLLTNDHEKLENLQGGDSTGHYHLTEAEHARLAEYPEYGEISHEKLSELLGGDANGHYHLTEGEKEKLSNYPEYEQVNHEEISGLLGGDTNGHYHLTQAEVTKLKEYPPYNRINHEDIDGLQGGKAKEHYHLTQAERDKLVNYPEYGAINHEEIQGLLGGDALGHFHMTQAERDKLANYPDYRPVNHEEISGLLGGNTDGHYHLTAGEKNKLNQMITEFFPDGSSEIVVPASGTDNHEALTNLMGGQTAGHYHLTNDELTKIRRLLDAVFSGGTDVEIHIPTFDDIYGGLPKGTAPQWQVNSLPDGYTATNYKMYYGHIPYKNTPVPDSLLVVFNYANVSSHNITLTKVSLENGMTVERRVSCIQPNGTSSIPIYANAYTLTNDGDNIYVFYKNPIANKQYAVKIYCYTISTSSEYIRGMYDANLYTTTDPFAAMSQSSALNALILVTRAGAGYLIKGTARTAIKTKVSINYGCAAWTPIHQVFCVCGADGTATSADGIAWDVHKDAPKNLADMSYREDLKCFFARSLEDKMFYASGDGATWQRVNNTPIPLENLTAVHYSPELGWYCAVGTGGRTAYFSRDLEHWVGTTIRNSDIDIADVIYVPSAGLYVAMPTSGSYYYTFNPSNWTDK